MVSRPWSSTKISPFPPSYATPQRLLTTENGIVATTVFDESEMMAIVLPATTNTSPLDES